MTTKESINVGDVEVLLSEV